MAPVTVPLDKVREFANFRAFYDWLAENHDSADEIWIRIFKKGAGKPTITPVEAIDAVLCWGWIDAIKKSWDAESFVQRYCPRRPKSVWSQINRDNVARLTAAGLMTGHGQKHVDLAKADGRWDAAYKINMEPAPEFLAALAANPAAQKTYETLSSQNRFALTFRIHNLKTEAGKQKKIATFIEMLAKGETIYPQG